MRWQEYWYVVEVSESGVFEPLGPPRQVPNVALPDSTLEAFVDALLADGVAELDDLRGELRVRVFETPAADTEPVLARVAELR